jgi:hypothetical protein
MRAVLLLYMLLLPVYSRADCAKLILSVTDLDPAFQTPAYSKLGLTGFLAERTRVLAPAAFEAGAFDRTHFLQYWNAVKTYRGGALYTQLLLRWAQHIDSELGKEMGDLFLMSVANRRASVDSIATQVGTLLPSVWDLQQVSQRVVLSTADDRGTRHAATEKAFLQSLQWLDSPLSGEQNPLEALRALRRFLRVDFAIRRRPSAEKNQAHLLLNLSGYQGLPSSIKRRFSWFVYSPEGYLLAGGFFISRRLATQLRADLHSLRSPASP